jgi:hypothetical protein
VLRKLDEDRGERLRAVVSIYAAFDSRFANVDGARVCERLGDELSPRFEAAPRPTLLRLRPRAYVGP